MFNAVTIDDQKISINNSISGIDYYCPLCKSKMIRKLGNINIHHFAHIKGSNCDPWYREMSKWHRCWQSIFPIEQQEVVVGAAPNLHIADIRLLDTIIEFQHSTMTNESFEERTQFYLDNSKRIIWVVDCFGKEIHYIEDIRNKYYKRMQIDTIISNGKDFSFIWSHRKKIFDEINISDEIQLFLHINENTIIRVLSKNGYYGLHKFNGNILSMEEFLIYIANYNYGKINYYDQFKGYGEYYRRLYDITQWKKWINSAIREGTLLNFIDDETKRLFDLYLEGKISYDEVKKNKCIKNFCRPSTNNFYF